MNELFKNISEKNKEKILSFLEINTLTFGKNNMILNNIRNTDFICLILYGSLQLIRTDINGNKIVLENIEENNIFSSLSYPLKNDEYEVLTKEPTKILIIDYSSIFEIPENKFTYYNQFLKNIITILTNKTRVINERIEILSNKTIRDKVLDYFRITSNKSKSKVIYLPYTYIELAEYLGVNRSALSREIKNLKDDGLIETKGRKIKLLYDR